MVKEKNYIMQSATCSEENCHCFCKKKKKKSYFNFCLLPRPDHFFASILVEAAVPGLCLLTALFKFVLCDGVHFSDLHKHCSVVCDHFRYKPQTGTVLKAVCRWGQKNYFSRCIHRVTIKLAITFAFHLPVQIPKTKDPPKATYFVAFVLSRWLVR